MEKSKLALRWLSLIQAGERNARVCQWWEFYRDGNRTPRIQRMRAINRAASRTDIVYWHLFDAAYIETDKVQ